MKARKKGMRVKDSLEWIVFRGRWAPPHNPPKEQATPACLLLLFGLLGCAAAQTPLRAPTLTLFLLC